MGLVDVKNNKYASVLSTIKYGYVVVLIIVAIIIFLIATKSKDKVSTEVVKTETIGSEFEIRLENIVCNIKGVNNARVMLSYDDYAEVGQDGSTNASNILGVIVVRESNGNISTDMAIKSALQTLLNIDTNKIKILDGKIE